MRAIVFPGGGVEALEMTELPDPEPKAGEVLIRVRACAMNHLDVWATGPARPGGAQPAPSTTPAPRILGADIAGEIVALGQSVTGFTAGARVVSYPSIPCEQCQECHLASTGTARP